MVRLDKIFKKKSSSISVDATCLHGDAGAQQYVWWRAAALLDIREWAGEYFFSKTHNKNISLAKHPICFTNTKQCTSSTVKQTKGPKVKLKRENKFFLQFWEREILKSCFQKRYQTNPKFSFSCFEKRNLNKIIFFSFKNTNNCLKFFSLISGKEKWRLYSSSPMPPFLLLVVGKQYRLVAQY